LGSGVDIYSNSFIGPKIVSIGWRLGKGEVRKMRGRGNEKGKDPQVWRKETTWNPEIRLQVIVQHISRIAF